MHGIGDLPDPPRASHGLDDDRLRFRRWAFLLGLIGGVLILAGAFLLALLMAFLGTFGGWPAAWAWGGEEGEAGLPFGVVALMVAVWGLLAGALTLYSAWRVRDEDENTLPASIGLVAGGILSFFALGGFVVGGLAAIAAGVLAVAGSRPLAFERAPKLA